jgi:hypothetical protein
MKAKFKPIRSSIQIFERRNMSSEYKQFIIDLKTLGAYSSMDYYNALIESITALIESVKNRKEHTHEDDDNTNAVLRDMIDYLESAICCMEDLKFYDGDGNRLQW